MDFLKHSSVCSGNHSREPPVHPPWYGKGISGPRQHPSTMRARRAPTLVAPAPALERHGQVEESTPSGLADARIHLLAGVRPEEVRAIGWGQDMDLDGNPASVTVLRGGGDGISNLWSGVNTVPADQDQARSRMQARSSAIAGMSRSNMRDRASELRRLVNYELPAVSQNPLVSNQARATSATSFQPPSMLSEWPRPSNM
jgi:hypothetical protein